MSNWTDPRVVDWAKEHFAHSPLGGVWSPDGTGLIFLKTDTKEWTLQKAIQHPACIETLHGIRTVMFDLGYSLNEKNTEWKEPPATLEEAQRMEVEEKKQIAKSWADKDGTKLIDMNPYNTFPEFIKMEDVLLEGGDTQEIEIWAYRLLNPNTGEHVEIDPDDYHLLTDDRAFMRYMNREGDIIQALTRREMMEMADAGEQGLLIGSVDPVTKEKIPLWLYGTYCKVIDPNEEEE